MATKANEIEEEEKVVLIPTIIVGDSRGYLHILSLDIDFRSSVEHAQKLKNEKYFKEGKKEETVFVGVRVLTL